MGRHSGHEPTQGQNADQEPFDSTVPMRIVPPTDEPPRRDHARPMALAVAVTIGVAAVSGAVWGVHRATSADRNSALVSAPRASVSVTAAQSATAASPRQISGTPSATRSATVPSRSPSGHQSTQAPSPSARPTQTTAGGAASTPRSTTVAPAPAEPAAAAVESRTPPAAASGGSEPSSASRPTAQEPVGAAAEAGSQTCNAPKFATSDAQGGWETQSHFVYNNMWNASEAGPQTLRACSFHNWYVVSNQRNLPSNPGSVKSYPNVHKDYGDKPISSFSTLNSRFAATAPGTGIYNVAYDLWLNGIATPGSTEVMIWTENQRQVPLGDKVATTNIGGQRWSVWRTKDSHYFAFVATSTMRSGTVELRQMLDYLMDQGWLSRTATLGQIGFGVEIVDTGGKDATFAVTDFGINAQ